MRRNSASLMYLRLAGHTAKNMGEVLVIIAKSKIRTPKDKELERLEYLMAEVDHQFETLEAFGPSLEKDRKEAERLIQERKARKGKR